MTADEFVKIVRNGSDKLRVDDVVFNTGSEEFHGKGLIRISRESIDVDLTINKGEKVPEVKTGIYTKRDYWKLTGIPAGCGLQHLKTSIERFNFTFQSRL
jgi:hypothetical protein